MEKNNQCIKIQNLKKMYSNKKLAVNNLNLTIYDSQIFVLLGHNGAGKTTTISMLNGMIKATSGSITECGMDVNTQLKDIRKQMGFCP